MCFRFFRFMSLFIIPLFLMSSCDGFPANSSKVLSEDEVVDKIRELKIDLLVSRTKMYDELIKKHEDLLKRFNDREEEAVRRDKSCVSFDLTRANGGGFLVVESSPLPAIFLVSVVDANSCPNGYRVAFRIGNMSSATFSALDVTLVWYEHSLNLLAEDMDKEMEDWRASRREKEYNVVKDFLPGAWSDVSIVMSPASTKALERVYVSINASSVSLLLQK